MYGWRGIAAGILAGATLLAIGVVAEAARGPIDPASLAVDAVIVLTISAVLGLAFNVVDKLAFFAKYSTKAEAYAVAIIALAALTGRGQLLAGRQLYSLIASRASAPLIGDVAASLIAAAAWSGLLTLYYAPLARRRKKPQSPLKALLAPLEERAGRKAPPPPPPPPGYVVCPRCGALNEAGSKYCIKCGARLPAAH